VRNVRIIAVVVVAVLIGISVPLMGVGAVNQSSSSRPFSAQLSGQQAVPPISTRASGQATFMLSSDGKELGYKLDVSNIDNVTMAHIHLAPAGKNGPIVVWLYSGPTKTGGFSGTLAEGTITAADLRGQLAGKTIADLVKEIDAGNAYVNVHTEKYPAGEIRGQIQPGQAGGQPGTAPGGQSGGTGGGY